MLNTERQSKQKTIMWCVCVWGRSIEWMEWRIFRVSSVIWDGNQLIQLKTKTSIEILAVVNIINSIKFLQFSMWFHSYGAKLWCVLRFMRIHTCVFSSCLYTRFFFLFISKANTPLPAHCFSTFKTNISFSLQRRREKRSS